MLSVPQLTSMPMSSFRVVCWSHWKKLIPAIMPWDKILHHTMIRWIFRIRWASIGLNFLRIISSSHSLLARLINLETFVNMMLRHLVTIILDELLGIHGPSQIFILEPSPTRHMCPFLEFCMTTHQLFHVKELPFLSWQFRRSPFEKYLALSTREHNAIGFARICQRCQK